MDGSTDGGDREGRPMSLSEVSNILWRERRLLDFLVFKLEEERFVLESGRMRWLTHAMREVEKVLEQINRLELERAMAVAGTSRELRTSDAPSLREMAAIAAPPWDGIFAAHRSALLLLVCEIDAIAESNSERLQHGQLAALEALAAPGEIDINTDDASAAMTDRPRGLRLVTQNAGNLRQRSVRSVDMARISQAGSNSDEEMPTRIQPSLAAFLQ
jgi:hypothetical protein